MTKAIRIHETGGPEVLRWDDITVGRPGPGEVRLRHTAIGINFMDIYHRRGLYPLPSLPTVLGVEGAGLVEEVGPEVKDLAAGQRVAYISMPPGAYAQERLIPADHLVILPDGIEDQQAAAAISKGMTAEYLLRRTYPVQPNDFILVHAAAGGVGLMLCQWASHLGANVIGTVSSDEKADIARANGCGYPIVYTRENFAERVREITNGEGVAVVYDSVGNTTFEGSVDCLRPRGLMVSFGAASGPVPPIDAMTFTEKGSLYFTRPTLFTYIAEREDRLATATALFDVILNGHVNVNITQTYPLEDAPLAHRELETRRTTGSMILIPD